MTQQQTNGINYQLTPIIQAAQIGSNFIKQMQQNPINWKNYPKQVYADQQNPFFNNNGNNPLQWLGKVGQDVQKRGTFEGLQDLSYPLLMNPYIEPVEEPIVGNMRVANYQAGRPFPLLNSLLGQSDSQYSGGQKNGIQQLIQSVKQKGHL